MRKFQQPKNSKPIVEEITENRVFHYSLKEKDMDMFGYNPAVDPLILVKCIHCENAVKASRFSIHTACCMHIPEVENFIEVDKKKSFGDCVAHNNDILCQKNNFETGDPKKRGKEKRKNHSNETQPETKRKHMWIPSLAQQCLQVLPKSAQVKNNQFFSTN